MTKIRILLVGDYPVLLDTRKHLLKEWEPESASSGEALAMIHAASYELIVIGQSVPTGAAIEIVSAAKASNPRAQVLAIRFPGYDVDLGVETHVSDVGERPSWLPERVAVLLRNKKLLS